MKNVTRQLCLWSTLAAALMFPLAGRAELVGYWSFQNSSDVGEDFSGLNNNLTTVGNASYAVDPTRGGVLQLDGDGDYLEASTFPTGVPTGTGANYTIALWYKFGGSAIDGSGNFFVGWGKAWTSAQVNALTLWPVNGFKNLWLGSGNDFVVSVSSAIAWVSDGEWYHVAITYDGSLRSLYLDGELLATNERTGLDAQAENFTIGHSKLGPGMADFNGLMDDVVIYDTALSQSEVQSVMNGNIPEPATALVLLVGGVCTICRKRNRK